MSAEQHRCVICLSSPPHEPATIEGCSCGHEFCLECLQQWCRTRRQPTCPLCQHAITRIVHGGSAQDAPPPDRLEEEGPDLGCLDHAYFSAESDRLLCRARAAQMHLVRSAYGCGRSGSSSADDASETLQQVIDTLAGVKDDMQHEVPFQPEAVLHELYSLEQIVSSIAAGGWAAGGGRGGGGDAQPAARFSADDAAAGLHEWQEHSDSGDSRYSDDDDGLDSRTRKRLERASLSSTPGRRPTPGGGGRRGGGGGGGALAARGSSGSLSAGSGRRR